MPERSPLTSAMNTGTPMRENPSASTCRVTVLPVPVAPATRPWRLASPGSKASVSVPALAKVIGPAIGGSPAAKSTTRAGARATSMKHHRRALLDSWPALLHRCLRKELQPRLLLYIADRRLKPPHVFGACVRFLSA